MSNQNTILAMVVAIVVILGGGWYLVQHDRAPMQGGESEVAAADESLVIGMPPLMVPESKEGRVVNIALLVIGLATGNAEDAERVRAAVPELRSEYKEDLEEYLTDRPDTSREERIADFATRITAINNRMLGEGTITRLDVDEPTTKPNDEPVVKQSN
jgi:hypothetical protein